MDKADETTTSRRLSTSPWPSVALGVVVGSGLWGSDANTVEACRARGPLRHQLGVSGPVRGRAPVARAAGTGSVMLRVALGGGGWRLRVRGGGALKPNATAPGRLAIGG